MNPYLYIAILAVSPFVLWVILEYIFSRLDKARLRRMAARQAELHSKGYPVDPRKMMQEYICEISFEQPLDKTSKKQ